MCFIIRPFVQLMAVVTRQYNCFMSNKNIQTIFISSDICYQSEPHPLLQTTDGWSLVKRFNHILMSQCLWWKNMKLAYFNIRHMCLTIQKNSHDQTNLLYCFMCHSRVNWCQDGAISSTTYSIASCHLRWEGLTWVYDESKTCREMLSWYALVLKICI